MSGYLLSTNQPELPNAVVVVSVITFYSDDPSSYPDQT